MSRKRRQDATEDDAGPSADATLAKRRRQYTEEDAKLAVLFGDLSSETEGVRMNAAKEVVKKFLPQNDPAAQAVDRAIIRLIRGLCSNRKAARLGFGIALTEILHQLFGPGSTPLEGLEVSAENVVDLVIERTKPDASAAGQVSSLLFESRDSKANATQERKDHLIGQIAGYRAILESSVLVQPSVPLECWNSILDHVYELARDKPWLREECGSTICGTVGNLRSIEGNTKYTEEIVGRLSTYNLAKTPEGVAIWLVTRSTFSEDVLPEGVWRKKDPLCTKERRVLANVLKENFVNVADSNPDSKNVKGGSAHSKPSFAWHFVLREMLDRENKSDFAKFWIDVVDGNCHIPAYRGFEN
jgi:exonuclease V gamma subunit